MKIILPFSALAAGKLDRFTDEAGLLTASQAMELTAKLDEISARQQFDIVVAVVNSRDERVANLYAADFYEENGFGYGKDLDGIILLISMEYRDFGFATTGYGLEAFTSYGQEYLEKLFLPHLKSGNYNKAFTTFADAADDFLTKAKAGDPYTYGNIPLTIEEQRTYRLYSALGSLLVALLIAFSFVSIWKSQLKTVRREDLAHAYARQGSMVVTTAREQYLYKNVSKTKRVKDQRKGGGGGGFRSSSGRGFGGRSGRF